MRKSKVLTIIESFEAVVFGNGIQWFNFNQWTLKMQTPIFIQLIVITKMQGDFVIDWNSWICNIQTKKRHQI